MVSQRIVKKNLIAYLKKLKAKIVVDRAYLIGSWAKNQAKKDSDVDLLILSHAFSNLDQDERLRILYRQTAGIDFDLHIHAVTPEELKNASRLTSLGAMEKDKKVALI
ncbi:nucleotidyltransferase domain-containing protein [Candidatus Gottesmanbacteria bacterium]|nr:nucleotidyltransferase domain-containing protein [Candidatus Gottesmanbacteria bacterium]